MGNAPTASETLTLFPMRPTESDRTPDKKDSKLILALSDSFRKVLILRVLASSTAFNRLWPEKTSTTKRGDPFNYILTAASKPNQNRLLATASVGPKSPCSAAIVQLERVGVGDGVVRQNPRRR